MPLRPYPEIGTRPRARQVRSSPHARRLPSIKIPTSSVTKPLSRFAFASNALEAKWHAAEERISRCERDSRSLTREPRARNPIHIAYVRCAPPWLGGSRQSCIAGKALNPRIRTSPCGVTDPANWNRLQPSANDCTALEWAANRGDRTRTCDPWSPRLVLISRCGLSSISSGFVRQWLERPLVPPCWKALESAATAWNSGDTVRVEVRN